MAVERQDQIKATKDITQGGGLIEVLAVRRPLELAEAWQEAWQDGERWRQKLVSGKERLPKDTRLLLDEIASRAERATKRAMKR